MPPLHQFGLCVPLAITLLILVDCRFSDELTLRGDSRVRVRVLYDSGDIRQLAEGGCANRTPAWIPPACKRSPEIQPFRSRLSDSASLMVNYKPIPFVLQANKFPNPRRDLNYAGQIMLPEFGDYFVNALLVWIPTACARRTGESMG